MKSKHVHIHVHDGFEEGKHPRASNGEFGAGQSSKPSNGYHIAKAAKAHIESEVAKASKALQNFPSSATGMHSDEVKNSPEFKAAKLAYNNAFTQLQNFSTKFQKQFSKEIKAERKR